MLIILLIISDLYYCRAEPSPKPGFTVSTSLHGLNQLTHHFLGPYFFSRSEWFPLPDEFPFSGGKVKDVEVLLLQPKDLQKDIKFDIDTKNKTIRMNGHRMYAQMRGNFTFTFMYVEFSGQVYSNVSDMTVIADSRLRAVPDETGRLAPQLEIVNLEIEIDPNNIQVKLEGSVVAKIAEVFTEIFKNKVAGKVVEASKQEVYRVVDRDVNKKLLIYGTHDEVPGFESLFFDYS
jgi:hypothetical protein